MRKLHTLLDGLGKLGRRRRAGGTLQHRNPPRHRLARVEVLEDRHLLSLGDLLHTLNDPGVNPEARSGIGYGVAADGAPSTVTATSPSLAGGTLGAGTTSLSVTFSTPVVGGDLAANYQLQSLGPDALLGTADDTIVSLSPAYAGNTATLTFDPLPESVYRLTVRDTIADPGGNPLDGNADDTPGGDWRRTSSCSRRRPFYSTPTYSSGGSSPYSVAIGDLNGDGYLDMASPNRGSGSVGVLFGQPGGTLRPRRPTTPVAHGQYRWRSRISTATASRT